MEWLGQLLATFVGGGMAILGGYLSYRLQEKQRSKALYREKGEELYSQASQWLNFMIWHHLSINFVMQGKLTYEQHNDSIKEKEGFDYNRLSLLIDVYFPSARACYDQIMDCKSSLNKIEAEYGKHYDFRDDASSILERYLETQKQFERLGDNLKQHIIKCIKEI